MRTLGRALRLTIATTALITIASTFVLSQGPPSPGPRTRQTDGAAVFKELGLTQEQSQKIAAILKKYRQDVGNIFRSSISAADKQDKLAALKSKAAADISNLLTPAQRQKAKEKNLIDRLLSKAPGSHVRFMVALDQLNLTDAQRTKVKTILDDLQAKVSSIMSDASLTRDQKRSKIADARQLAMDKIKLLLTAEQKKKFDELIKSRPGPAPAGGPARRGNRSGK